MDWSASQYLRYQDERTRPAQNLLDAVPNIDPQDVVDIGCGPGNSTELLVRRYPGAKVSGMDSSPDMLAQARQALPNVDFELDQIESWKPEQSYDVIFSNAVLQWLPDHATLLPRLAGYLKPGGTLAFQVPDNLDEPSHRSMRDVAQTGPWAARLEAANAARSFRTEIYPPAGYYALLAGQCTRIDVWRTVYHHALDGAEAIVEWFKGTGLRPYLAQLDAEEKRAFTAEYLRLIESRYPRQPDGKVLLAFPRLFVVATR
jgi:trans-aconitate 2-methyltransferase